MVDAPLSPEDFQAATDVSRETLAKLATYAERLSHWQRRINLVGPSTLDDIWRRHFLDSAQLAPLVPDGASSLVDLGSGAGFPGLVLAIMGVASVELIESNQRKCAFLAEVARRTETTVKITNQRIEAREPANASVVTARACAPLDRLLPWIARHLAPDGTALIHKGAKLDEELTAVDKAWTMTTRILPGAADGVILEIKDLKHER